MQSKMLVVLDLLFKKEKNHSHGYEVFREIPDFIFNVNVRKPCVLKGGEKKHRRPGEEAVNGDEPPRGRTAVRVPAMDAAVEVNGEKYRIHSAIEAIGRLPLDEQEKGRKAGVQNRSDPPKGMSKSVHHRHGYRKRSNAEQDSRKIE